VSGNGGTVHGWDADADVSLMTAISLFITHTWIPALWNPPLYFSLCYSVRFTHGPHITSQLNTTPLYQLSSHSAPDAEPTDATKTDDATSPSTSTSKPPAASGDDVKIDEEDVKLVVAQTGCTEEKAKEALKAENGDLINASEFGCSFIESKGIVLMWNFLRSHEDWDLERRKDLVM
jgi:NACalpha-BTF3-like transcription factor